MDQVQVDHFKSVKKNDYQVYNDFFGSNQFGFEIFQI